MSESRHRDAGTPTSPRASGAGRVLVVRCARPAQVAEAVRIARARHPQAEIVALSHPGHLDSLRAAGVDRVSEIGGGRFGLTRLSPAALRRLRREGFDEVVIPQMYADPVAHGNVYRVAALAGAPQVTIVASGRDVRTLDVGTLRREVVRNIPYEIARRFESPLVLFAVLVAASFVPRRRRFDSRCSLTPGRNQRTRVLHIIGSLGVGGAQRQLAEVVNRTPADRYDVEVLVMEQAGGEFSRQWFARDVPVTFLTQWPRFVSTAFAIARHCRRGRYDVVHTWLFLSNVVGAAGARLAGVPAVIASVRSMSLWKRTWYRQWWYRAADVLGSRAADVVTVNAEALAGDHAAWAFYPRTRIAVIQNGLDPAGFDCDTQAARARLREIAGLPGGTPVIGTVGRLAVEKDHATFLRVIREIRSVRPRVHGVIVGDGPMRAELESAAAGMGLTGAVTFLGERRDACELMAGFDAFLLPSTIEGFPNVLLEAAFLGVPSVATRVGGCPDVLPHGEDAFAPGDAATAARRLLALLDTPGQAAASAARTRARALDLFTAERTARRWCELYDRVLAPRKGAPYASRKEARDVSETSVGRAPLYGAPRFPAKEGLL